jgi:predicted MFS family arabinose efflux permease
MNNTKENTFQTTRRNVFTRDFVLGFFAFFFFLAAISSLIPTLPIYLTRLGSNEREIGLLIGILAVASLASRLFVGGALLKYRAKSVMMIGALGSAITFLAYIIFHPFWPLFVVRLLQGVAWACIDTAAITSIISVIPPAYRARALGYFMLAPSLAMATAAPFGMFLINQYSFTILFLSCAGLSLCTLFLYWKVKGQEVSAPSKATPSRFNSLLNLKIIPPAIASFLQLFVWGAVTAFFPLYALQCGVANPGLFFSAMAISMIFGRIFGGKILDNFNKEKIMMTCFSIAIVALITLSLSRTLPMFIIVGSFWGIGAAFFLPVSLSYGFEYAGTSDGAAVGTFRAFSDLGLGVGPVAVGIVIPLTGYRITFLCLALIVSFNLCYFHFYVRKRHSMSISA